MAESTQNQQELAAGPNVNELVWAINAAEAEADQEGEGSAPQDLGDLDVEPAAADDEPAPTSSSSNKKKKKKPSKAKTALNKLKGKLDSSGTAASKDAAGSQSPGSSKKAQDWDEAEVKALQTELQQRIRDEHGQGMADKLTPDIAAQILQQASLQDLRKQTGSAATAQKPAGPKTHKFWSTQPVPQDVEQSAQKEGAIEDDKTPDQIKQEPLALPAGFEWCTVELNDAEQLQEVYSLLTHHYVEDADASFRFDYSGDFFKWALQPPGYVKDWHIGVRVSKTQKLVAFISGIPVDLRVRDLTKHCSEINFLCVHKKLRSKRLTPVLIQEVTRRCNLAGVFQAIYTAGVHLPTPVACCQYFHRQLNTKKLIDLGFAGVPRHKTLAGVIREHALPTETSTPGLREMRNDDVKAVTSLLRAYLARFEMAPLFDEDLVRHNFVSGRGTGESVQGRRQGQVTWSYVVQDPATAEITDFFSMYHLPSTAIHQQQIVDAAYIFYYATNAAGALSQQPTTSSDVPAAFWSSESPQERVQLKKRLVSIMGDCCVIAKNAKFDVVNCVTCLDNSLFIHDLKFGPGDGKLHYYLYNWLAKPIAGGTLSENQAAASHGGAEAPALGPAPAGMNVRECGSGVGMVML